MLFFKICIMQVSKYRKLGGSRNLDRTQISSVVILSETQVKMVQL